jgi:release factor glutamine methyltransferase
MKSASRGLYDSRSAGATECGRTIRGAVQWASRLLADVTESPRLDAELLLAHVLHLSREALYAHGERRLDGVEVTQYERIARRRLAQEPVAYLVGQRAFYDVELTVDARVLIPRPETELLVGFALEWGRSRQVGALRVADVGTGSGAIAIVLARHLPGARIVATDISLDALCVAVGNIGTHGLQGRIALLQADLLASIAGPLDLIISNPPYVPRGRLPSLPWDVRGYEPMQALDGGAGGWEVIERLLQQAAERLASPGLLLVEIDATHRDVVRAAATSLWPQGSVSIAADYTGRDRVLRVEIA